MALNVALYQTQRGEPSNGLKTFIFGEYKHKRIKDSRLTFTLFYLQTAFSFFYRAYSSISVLCLSEIPQNLNHFDVENYVDKHNTGSPLKSRTCLQISLNSIFLHMPHRVAFKYLIIN